MFHIFFLVCFLLDGVNRRQVRGRNADDHVRMSASIVVLNRALPRAMAPTYDSMQRVYRRKGRHACVATWTNSGACNIPCHRDTKETSVPGCQV